MGSSRECLRLTGDKESANRDQCGTAVSTSARPNPTRIYSDKNLGALVYFFRPFGPIYVFSFSFFSFTHNEQMSNEHKCGTEVWTIEQTTSFVVITWNFYAVIVKLFGKN